LLPLTVQVLQLRHLLSSATHFPEPLHFVQPVHSETHVPMLQVWHLSALHLLPPHFPSSGFFGVHLPFPSHIPEQVESVLLDVTFAQLPLDLPVSDFLHDMHVPEHCWLQQYPSTQ
jgi:hypothetical protein